METAHSGRNVIAPSDISESSFTSHVEKEKIASGGARSQEEDLKKLRVVYLNDSVKNRNFCGNIVVTAKYTLFSFWPRFMYERFSQVYPILVNFLSNNPK